MLLVGSSRISTNNVRITIDIWFITVLNANGSKCLWTKLTFDMIRLKYEISERKRERQY